MPIELTTAVLLIALALGCAAWVGLVRPTGAAIEVGAPRDEAAGPDDAEWRDAALRHYRDRRDLEQALARALGTPGAITGPQRRELIDALGPGARPASYAPVDVFA